MSKLCRYKVGHVEIVFRKNLADEDDVGHPKQVRARSLASADAPRPAFLYDSHSEDEATKEEQLRAKLAEQREANKRDYKSKTQRRPKPGLNQQAPLGKGKSKKQLAVEQRRREKEMAEIASQLEEQAKINEEKEEQRRAAEEERQSREEEERQTQRKIYAKERHVIGEKSDADRKGIQSGSSTQSLNNSTEPKDGAESARQSVSGEAEENSEEQYVSDDGVWSEDEEPKQKPLHAQQRADKSVTSRTSYSRQSGQSQRATNSRYSYQSQQNRSLSRGRQQHGHRAHSQRYVRPDSDDSYWPGQEDAVGFQGHNQPSNQQQFNSDLPPRFRNQQIHHSNKQRRDPRESRDTGSSGSDWHAEDKWVPMSNEKGSGWGSGRGGASNDVSGWINMSPQPSRPVHTAPRHQRYNSNSGKWNSHRDSKPSTQSNTWTAALDNLQPDSVPKKGQRKGVKTGVSGVVLPDELDPEPEWTDPVSVGTDSSSNQEQWSSSTDQEESWVVEDESGLWKPSDGSQKTGGTWDHPDRVSERTKHASRGQYSGGRPTKSAPVSVTSQPGGRGRGGQARSQQSQPKGASDHKDPELMKKVQMLTEMGFEKTLVMKTLVQNNFDFEAALGDLLAYGAASQGTPPNSQSSPHSRWPVLPGTATPEPHSSHTPCQAQVLPDEQLKQKPARSPKLVDTVPSQTSGVSVGTTPQPSATAFEREEFMSAPKQADLTYESGPSSSIGLSQGPPTGNVLPAVDSDNLPSDTNCVENWPFIVENLPSVPALAESGMQPASPNLAALPVPGLGWSDAISGVPDDTSLQEHARKLNAAVGRVKNSHFTVHQQRQMLALQEAEVEKSGGPKAGVTLQQISLQRLRLRQYYEQQYVKMCMQQQAALISQAAQGAVPRELLASPSGISTDRAATAPSALSSSQLLPPSEFIPGMQLTQLPKNLERSTPFNGPQLLPAAGSVVNQPQAASFPLTSEPLNPFPMIGGRPTQPLDLFLQTLDNPKPGNQPPSTQADDSGDPFSLYQPTPARNNPSANTIVKGNANTAPAPTNSEEQPEDTWSGKNTTQSLLGRAVDSALSCDWNRRVEQLTPMSPGVFYGDGLSGPQSEPVWPSATTASVIDSVPGVIGSNRPVRCPPGLGRPTQDAAALAKDAGFLPSIPESTASQTVQNEENVPKASGWGELPPASQAQACWPPESGWQSTVPEDSVELGGLAGIKLEAVGRDSKKETEQAESWPWPNWEQKIGKPWPLLSPEDMSTGRAGDGEKEIERNTSTNFTDGDELARPPSESKNVSGSDEAVETALTPGSPWLLVENIPSKMEEGALRLLCQHHGTIHNFCFDRTRCAALLRYDSGQIASQAAIGLGEMNGEGEVISAKVATDAEIGLWIQESGVFSTSGQEERTNESQVKGMWEPVYAPQRPMRSVSAPHPLPPNGMGVRPGVMLPRMPHARMPHMWGMIPPPRGQAPLPMEYQGPMGGAVYGMHPAPWSVVPPAAAMSSVWTSRQPRGPNASNRGSSRGFRRNGLSNRQRSEEMSA